MNDFQVSAQIMELPEEERNGLVKEVNSSNSSNSYQQQLKPELKPEALYGLPGDIAKAIEPYSESDPVAILSNILERPITI
jgi:hypothetical protein